MFIITSNKQIVYYYISITLYILFDISLLISVPRTNQINTHSQISFTIEFDFYFAKAATLIGFGICAAQWSRGSGGGAICSYFKMQTPWLVKQIMSYQVRFRSVVVKHAFSWLAPSVVGSFPINREKQQINPWTSLDMRILQK